jgi:glycosyltransferase involved in cell wall biosynthesis
LKILHTEASLGWGGQEIRVLSEARGVMRAGHEVMLAAPAEARIAKEAPRFGVPVRTLAIGRKRPGGVLALRQLLDERFDVVNTHSSTDTWLAALACSTLSNAPPLVRTRHISAPMPRNAATRWLYARATDRIVTTGERLRTQVIDETGVAPDRVTSIPTGIDLARFEPGDRAAARASLGLPAEAPIVGIVATLRSWKGHRFLFDAIASMARKDVRLVVVGDGPQRESLEARAREADLAGRVTFAGNRDDVAAWMHAFDLFCLPSYANEGVPQALMQAMACGLAVVSTPVGSIDEIVTDAVSGVLVNPSDAQALRGAIERLLDDEGRRRALSARALETARQRFGESLMVERMLAVFADACGDRNKMTP